VDFEDFAAIAENFGSTETVPPMPNPMTWNSERDKPHSTGANAVTMRATTAWDGSGSTVEYYFDCNSIGGHDSGWITSSTYTDTGLVSGTTYKYHVKARDSRHNETGWSSTEPVTPTPDPYPPEPNQMTWAAVPAATGPSTITMTATTATDISLPVQYYFECTNYGEANSTWQTSTTYVASGLNPSTSYSFRVKARDSSAAQNQTGWSSIQSATTDANGPEPIIDVNAPTPDPSIWAAVPQPIQGLDPNRPATFWYHYMAAVPANDASPPVKYYFECVSGSGTSSGWIENSFYIAGPFLNINHSAYKVRTKDARGNVGQPSRIYHTYYGYLN
jgi:hypothetical protein